MPAKSEQQQQLFGLALSVKRGETPRSEVSDEVLGIVDSMSEKDIEDYAGTKHDDIPHKVKNEIRSIVREVIVENIKNELKEEAVMDVEVLRRVIREQIREIVMNERIDVEKRGRNIPDNIEMLYVELAKKYIGEDNIKKFLVAETYNNYTIQVETKSSFDGIGKDKAKRLRKLLEKSSDNVSYVSTRGDFKITIDKMNESIMIKEEKVVLTPKNGMSKGDAIKDAKSLFRTVEKAPKIKLKGSDDGVYDSRKTGTDASTVRIEMTVDSDKEVDLIKRLGTSYGFESEVKNEVKEEIEADSPYQAFFKKALEKFGVNSPDEFESEEKKKEFFDYVDKHWDAKNEEVNEKLEKLDSVGTVLDTKTKTTYPMLAKGGYDKNAGVELSNINKEDDWYQGLSSKDKKIVDKYMNESVNEGTINETTTEDFSRFILKALKKHPTQVYDAIEKFAGSVYGYMLPNGLHRSDVTNSHVKSVIKAIKDEMQKDPDYGKKMMNGFLQRLKVTDAKKYMNEADDTGIKYGDQGHVKFIPKGMNSKKRAKTVKVGSTYYKFNPTYQTYNSVDGNELLHKNDIKKAQSIQRENKESVNEEMDNFNHLIGKTVKSTRVLNGRKNALIVFEDGTKLEFTNDGYASIFEQSINETKFFVWYNKKKHEIEAPSLYKAKQKFIKQEKVPKSKQGLIAIKSADSMKSQDFRFN